MALSTDRQIVKLATSNDGIVSRSVLLQHGITKRAISTRSDGLLQPIARGVYLVGAPTTRAWLRAAVTATPTAVVADLSAAQLHGLATRRPQTPTVVAPHGTKTKFEIDAVHHRQTRWLPAEDQCVVDGFPSTTVERTICDLAPILFRRQFRHLLESSITERRITPSSFHACVRSFARRGRPGSTILRQATVELLSHEPIAGSALEQRAIALFRRAQLPPFEVQYRPPWYDGLAGIVDIAWPKRRLIVELDGRRWHTTSTAISNDRSRDRRAATAGWRVLRFGWQEIVERPALVTREISELLFAPLRTDATGPSAA